MPVDIVNETALALGFVAGRVRKSGVHLTAIVKGAFKLAHGGPATPAEEKPLLGGDAYWDDEAVDGSCKVASDFAPFKPRADVIVTGTCHPPAGRSAGKATVGLRLGTLRKSLAVFGDRHFVEQKLGGWDITEPVPFRSLPLRYEVAFGGPGFLDNPVGKGFGALSTQASRALPNIEHPGRLLKSPTDRVDPAGLGSLNRRWGLRTAKMGTYDASWVAERWPDFPLDFDWSYFNAAPADQQVDYLRGDEAIVIEGMHPEIPRFESWLPSVRPRCFLQKTGATAGGAEEVELVLDTVSIDMDALEMVLVWRGLAPVWSREYAEVEKALLVVEPSFDAPLPAATYRDASKWRPAHPSVEEQALAADAEARARVASATPPPPPAAAESADPAEIAEVEALRKELQEGGADAALMDRLKGVTKLVVFTAILTAHVEKLVNEAPPDPDPPKPPKAPVPAPPKPLGDVPPPKSPAEAARRERAAAEERDVARMRAELAESKPDPALLAKLDDVVTVAAFLAILVESLPPTQTPAEQKERQEALEAVRAAGARQKADALAEEAAERAQRGDRLTRAEVVAMLASASTFAGANMTELDLSGLDFSKRNLAGVLLSGAKLERTRFVGADLTAATFRKAAMRGAILEDAVATGADFEGAELGGAQLSRGSFAAANLTGSVLAGATLDGADFTGAKMAHANLAKASLSETVLDGAVLERASLRGAVGAKTKLRGADLSFADLAEAKLTGAVLVSAKIDHLAAAGVSLAGAFLDGARGDGASFEGADLTDLRAANVVLANARFADARAAGARFHAADLAGADFARATLLEADFSEALLVGASFHLARLEQAIFTKAKLMNARLTQANLFRGRLGGADLTDADCRASNFFECELFEANATRARFERSNVKRTVLDRSRA